jgi:uncharacterized paraquat-inducible protein A
MTLQKRFIASPHDVLAIRLTCKCGACLSLIPTVKINIRAQCPNCGTQWFVGNDLTQQLLEQLCLALGNLRNRSEVAPYKVEMEFNQPE